MKRIRTILAIVTLLAMPAACAKTIKKPRPKLAVVIVIDQFAHHYLAKLSPYFTDGFKKLMNNGACFHNAYHPHGAPSTAPGHATISTGTIVYDHGVILNGWVENNTKKATFSIDPSPSAAVLGNLTEVKEGRSSHQLLVDTLSGSLMEAASEQYPHQTFALSHKARSAIAMAGRRGKPVWFDTTLAGFTSSKTYFETIPSWVTACNTKYRNITQRPISWKLRYPAHHRAYHFENIDNRKYASNTLGMCGRKNIDLNGKRLNYEENDDDDFEDKKRASIFLRTPQANGMLLDLARECITTNFKRAEDSTFLLWISLSSLDIVGHEYGPSSREVIDMIYHLDQQIGSFMHFCQTKAGDKNTLFVLTGDHGVAPIPEIVAEKGFSLARRTVVKQLITTMNAHIEKKYGIVSAVAYFKTNQFYLNKSIPSNKRVAILQELKEYLYAQPGFKKIWTREELMRTHYASYELEYLFKNQCHPTRSGDLICMPLPYCAITKHDTGAAHRSPYNYDTHVPLIFYQRGSLEKKSIYRKVLIPQMTTSLAKLIGIPHTSSNRFSALPGISPKKSN